MMARLDVVIPVYKPNKRFYRLMTMVFAQDELPGRVQIMLTLSGVENEREMLLAKLQKLQRKANAETVFIDVKPLTKEDFDHGTTRNEGMASCLAPYVLCMTMDAVPADTTLFHTLVEAMEREQGTAAVYARQKAPKNANVLVQLTQQFNYPENSILKSKLQYRTLGIKSIFCSDVCCLYNRGMFFRLDAFPNKVIFGEDMLYAKKAMDAGYKVLYEAHAVVEHGHSYSLSQLFHRNFDNGVNQAEHPDIFRDLSSEKEGITYVEKVISTLASKGAYLAIVAFVLQCATKYAGFFLGKHYRSLPKSLVLRCTGNKAHFTE